MAFLMLKIINGILLGLRLFMMVLGQGCMLWWHLLLVLTCIIITGLGAYSDDRKAVQRCVICTNL